MKSFVIAAALVLSAAPALAGTPGADPQAPLSPMPSRIAIADAGSPADAIARQADGMPQNLTAGLSVPVTLLQPQVMDEPQTLAQADMAVPQP